MAAPYVLEQRDGRSLVRYVSTRLAFRRAALELLPSDGLLEIHVRPTAGGEFMVTMTRADFERDFAGVLRSKSWAAGIYSYPRLPKAVLRYITDDRRHAVGGSVGVPLVDADSTAAVPDTEDLADVAEWAAGWSKQVGVPAESAAYLGMVDAWRDAWRPERVRLLLVAESHMGELVGDTSVRVARPAAVSIAPPDGYCRLVYCLGYGENALCTPYPGKNSGTIQFWDIFGAVAWGFGQVQPRKAKSADFDARLTWKVATLNRLRDMGVWLVDASKAACSGAEGGRRFASPRVYKRVVQESWRRFVWPSVETDGPESIWIIGLGVSRALSGFTELATARVISQPQDRDKLRYTQGLAEIAAAAAPLREARSSDEAH